MNVSHFPKCRLHFLVYSLNIRTSHYTRQQCRWTLIPNASANHRPLLHFIGNRVVFFFSVMPYGALAPKIIIIIKGDASEPLNWSNSGTDGNCREAVAPKHWRSWLNCAVTCCTLPNSLCLRSPGTAQAESYSARPARSSRRLLRRTHISHERLRARWWRSCAWKRSIGWPMCHVHAASSMKRRWSLQERHVDEKACLTDASYLLEQEHKIKNSWGCNIRMGDRLPAKLYWRCCCRQMSTCSPGMRAFLTVLYIALQQCHHTTPRHVPLLLFPPLSCQYPFLEHVLWIKTRASHCTHLLGNSWARGKQLCCKIKYYDTICTMLSCSLGSTEALNK